MKLCLITEGTYPYHVGGVSTWTHALLQGIPDMDVTLVPLYAGTAPGPPIWTLPGHVSLLPPVRVPDSLAPADIASWAEATAPDIPRTDLVHTLTAGVAGRLGQHLQETRGTPLLVTEHGVGWYELQHGAGETETGFRPGDAATGCAEGTRKRAVRHLRHYAHTAYAAADRITAVAGSTQEKQHALGADPTRCHVIPNGVAVSSQPPSPPSAAPLHIGLVGRMTPLKDIRTFLRACALVQARHPDTQFSVVGPPTDAAYATQCHTLARSLGLADALTFVEDAREMSAWYARFDVVALTSRSEAQPLALLEAMAHARPVVATDVGDCRRLVTGPDDDIGPAGAVCMPGDVDGIADALLSLAETPSLRRTQGRAGWRRVRATYRRDQMVTAYRNLYAELTPRPQSSS